ncbi:MAG: polysaccharide biosynthesis protein [Desulfobacterales bacterium]|nr:polysaccharide biosynthesis protein [Desulfobacterales bacterium]
MKKRILYKNFIIVFIVDVLLLFLALYLSHLIRFDFDIPRPQIRLFIRTLPYILLAKLIILYFFDLYTGMWRYTSVTDLLNIVKASTFASLVIICTILFTKTRFTGFSRSVFFIDWCLTVLFISGFRLSLRLYFEHFEEKKGIINTIRHIKHLIFNMDKKAEKYLIIIGAGDCGEKIFRAIKNKPDTGYCVVGFLDDMPVKVGKKIHGITVLGATDFLPEVARKTRIDEAIIAIPSASTSEMRKIVDLCKKSGVSYKTVPSYSELINGDVSINSIRDVAYRDLLGREVIKLDQEKIGEYLRGKKILVTGAGGSIGSELCRQICRYNPKSILLYEISETPLYEIELELREKFESIEIIPLLGDITNKQHLDDTFSFFKPQTVFHAAAYKQVPVLELQPGKAILNNILGTSNLAKVSQKYDVKRFVFVSTDKAVRPTNVMGASKRVSEMLIQGKNAKKEFNTRFMIVRFGNVVGSVGSVVPRFKKQIESGGPVTVTHPEMTRFFMTIPEASQLILQAGSLGNGDGGEIFLLDMGTPVKIDEMARDLIRLSGFEPDVDIKIEYIGLRPGEKLYEELITEGENIVPTSHEKIMVLKGSACDIVQLNGCIEELATLAAAYESDKIKAKLKEIVPEYTPYRSG